MVSSIDGINQTKHYTNKQRPCTNQERAINLSILTLSGPGEFFPCCVKSRHRRHSWWRPSVNSFEFHSCDYSLRGSSSTNTSKNFTSLPTVWLLPFPAVPLRTTPTRRSSSHTASSCPRHWWSNANSTFANSCFPYCFPVFAAPPVENCCRKLHRVLLGDPLLTERLDHRSCRVCEPLHHRCFLDQNSARDRDWDRDRDLMQNVLRVRQIN